MHKHRKTKAKNQTYHFKKRCDERLGVQIDRKMLQRRIKELKFDETFYFLRKQSNRVSLYRYKFQNKWYIIPYDKNTHKVVTIFEDKNQDITQQTEMMTNHKNPMQSFINLYKNFIQFVKHPKILSKK